MSAPQPRRPEPPQQIGPYRVVERLGVGASGQVLRVVDSLGRQLALKLLRDPSSAQRFDREGQVAASLRHSGIVRVHGRGVTPEGRAYLVFELVEGEDLEASFRRLPGRELVRITHEVALALAHAHAQGVVHRDVKPQNVLVDGRGRARVADFGLAHAAGYERLTRTGVMVGTPHYMAPEQVTGQREEFGPPTDVWALGVLLYRVLTGHLPFEGGTLIELAAQITGVSPPPPRPVDPELPVALAEVCLRALEKDPAARYPDAQAFADDVGRALAGELIEGLPARRARWGTLALGAFLLGVLGVALLRGSAAGDLEQGAAPPQPGGAEVGLDPRRQGFAAAVSELVAGGGSERRLFEQARAASREPALATALWNVGVDAVASLEPEDDAALHGVLVALAPLASAASEDAPRARRAAEVALASAGVLLERGQDEYDEDARRALLDAACARLTEIADAGLRPRDRRRGVETLDALMALLLFGMLDLEPYWRGQLAGVRLDLPSFGDYFVPKRSMRTRPDWTRPWGADPRDPWERYFELRLGCELDRSPQDFLRLRQAYADPTAFGGPGWGLGPRQRAGTALMLSEAPDLAQEDALALVAEAQRQDPGSLHAFRREASLLRELGRLDDAVGALERGVALYRAIYPSNLYRRWIYNQLLGDLVRTHAKRGDRAAARAAWEELGATGRDLAAELSARDPWLQERE